MSGASHGVMAVMKSAGASYSFPSQGVLDQFIDTNGVDLPVHSANWTKLAGTNEMEVQSNSATGTAGTSSSYRNNANYGSTECYATIGTKPASTVYLALFTLLNTTTFNGYQLVITSESGTDTLKFSRLDGGVATQLGATISQEYSSGDSFGVLSEGGTHTIYYKPSGGSWGALTTRTDSTYTTAARIGMATNGTDIRVNDFGGGTKA